MKSDKQQVKKAVEKLGEKIHEGEMKKEKNITTLTHEFFKNGHMPKDIFNLSDTQIEGIYARAYNFYQVGRYSDAIQIFRVLVMLNGSEIKYILGLAACFQMMKEYKDAADIYTLCSLLDPHNPIPYYHMSDCFMNLKDIPSTKIALNMAIQKAGDKLEYQILKDRALMTLQSLENESKNMVKK